MKDCMNREIDYLRLSITERCNLNCVYCREGNEKYTNQEMSVDEIHRIVNIMASLGMNKVRITGGEPLIRKDLEEIIEGIAQNDGIKELCMTTNGQGLAKRVKALKAAGLKRMNISVDSLNSDRYNKITKGGKLSEVLDAIDESIACNLGPIKLNTVIIRGENDHEIDDFIALTKDKPIDVRFIELMPIGNLGQNRSKRVPTTEILMSRPYLTKVSPRYLSQPSEDYTIKGHVGRIGFISPMSHKFCNMCNRIRLTSDAKIKPCLGDNGEVILKDILPMSDEVLYKVIKKAIFVKPEGHHFENEYSSARRMSQIGG